MNDPAIDSLTHQLAANPDDWNARAQLAGLLEQRGDRHEAAHMIMSAPAMPQARDHALAAVRILTPVNPAASLPYLQLLGSAGGSAFGGMGSPAAAVFPAAAPYGAPGQPISAPTTPPGTPMPMMRPGPPPIAYGQAPTAYAQAIPVAYSPPAPDVEWQQQDHEAHPVPMGEVHLTELHKPKFAASRFAVVVLVHVVFLLIAAWWVIAQIIPKSKDKLSFDQTPPRTSAVKGTELAVKMAKKKSSSSAPASAKRVLSNVANAKISLPVVQVSSPMADNNFTAMGMGGAGLGFGLGGTGGNGTGGTGSGMGRGHFQGAFTMESRCTKGDREKRIAEGHGSPETEQHVTKALDYFKNTQNTDGSWGNQFKASMTGLALLCYLGHCETPDNSKAYADTVLKGIMYLIELNMKKGGLSNFDHGNQQFPYEHGIAAYALSEAYTMTRYGTKPIPNLRETVLAAVEIILKGQGEDGGWSYGYGPPQGGGSDMSVSGWQIQALNAAKHTGMEFIGLDECFKKAVKYLEDSQTPTGDAAGAFGYRGKASPKYSLTGVGCLCLIVAGKDHSKESRLGTDYIKKKWDADHKEFVYNGGTAGLYGSYYINQVAFMHGGSMWQKWNKSLQSELLPAQNADGSYKADTSADRAVTSDAAGGDATHYRSCLSTLMLEVYYRYLPATEKHTGIGGGD